MANITNAVDVPVFVESAEYKVSSTSGWMLCIVLLAQFSKTSVQKIWDNLMIDGSSVQAISYGRKKARELALACGLEERPAEDEVSKLVGQKATARITVDFDGNFKVLKYMLAETEPESKPVGSELTF